MILVTRSAYETPGAGPAATGAGWNCGGGAAGGGGVCQSPEPWGVGAPPAGSVIHVPPSWATCAATRSAEDTTRVQRAEAHHARFRGPSRERESCVLPI